MKAYHFTIEVEPPPGEFASFCEAVHAATLGEGTPAVHDDVFTARFTRVAASPGRAIGQAIDELDRAGLEVIGVAMEAGR